MTVNEYIKQEAGKHLDKVPNSMVNGPLLGRSFASGLSAGIELAKEFGDWVSDLRNANAVLRIIDKRPASELLEIFLTEKASNESAKV